MLIIEHDMPLIMAMSDRVYCLELGKVIAEGDPAAVRNDPLVIASYLGTDERTIARSGQVAEATPAAMSPATAAVGSCRGTQRLRVTILDVAALAGVHAATVSRALNRPEKVATETRVRVEEAVRELGFVPNRAARGLITGRTGNIAVIVPDITNPFFALLVRSVERRRT